MTDDPFMNNNFMLPVGDGHTLHVIDWGNREAKTPIIFLHGGPGGHVKDSHKVNFDPTTQRVIFFDQRGCGESLPAGELRDNDTDHLAEDITKIADHLDIDKFYLFGYSWGSTLALYYAITRPERVKGLVIGGVYSGANDLKEMARRYATYFPDRYDRFLDATPAEHRDNPTSYHLDRAFTGTEEEQKHSIYWLGFLESTLASFDSDFRPDEPYDAYLPDKMRIELHYMRNNCFMEKDFLLKNAHRITVPTYIVQGRCDMVCPPDFAYRIRREIPGSKIYFADSNHHSSREIFSLFKMIFDSLGN